MNTAAMDIRSRGLFFLGAPLSSAMLLLVVLAYGLATGFDYFSPLPIGNGSGFPTVSFYQIVIVLWFFSVDGSHLFHTLARALMLPEVFRRNRKFILFSFAFLIAGPVAVIWPGLMGAAFSLEQGTPLRSAVNALPVALLSMYFLWAYWHVTQQHWGFVALRARLRGSAPARRHRAFYLFTTALAPIVFFLMDGHIKIASNQALSTSRFLAPWGITPSHVVGAGACLFAAAVFFTFVAQWGSSPSRTRVEAEPLDGSSSFLLVSTSAVHLAVMSLPPLALFVHPIITLGHDLQYHAICYFEGRERARASREAQKQGEGCARPGAMERLFYWMHERKYGIFVAAVGFAFFSTSPMLFTDAVASLLAHAPFPLTGGEATRVAVGASTFFLPPPLESQLLNAFCIGFAAQHYYLDGKLWKLSRDPSTRVSVMAALGRKLPAADAGTCEVAGKDAA
jgi:hypothetical protein